MNRSRREFLTGCAGLLALGCAPRARAASAAAGVPARKFKLGLVTYNVAAEWDLATIVDVCRKAGVEGVEFRTTHAHGVEPALGAARRAEVKARCADAGVAIWGLGSTCEFHSTDPAVVKQNIETCGVFARLAADIGARGVKVRPNAFPAGVPKERTLAQIGAALVECGKVATDHGVEIWLEVHGRETQEPANIRAIMDACPSAAVGVCWNSNPTDVRDGSVRAAFDLLKGRILSSHINDLDSKYPYAELFGLMRQMGYDRYTLCEFHKKIPAAEGVEFLKRYRERWLTLADG